MLTIILAALIKIVAVLGGVFTLAALLTWMERRQSAMMQDRIGPTRANIGKFTLFGLLHPLADALKLVMKEDFVPPSAHKTIYTLAPLFALVPIILIFAVIPFGPTVCLDQLHVIGPDVTQCRMPQHLQIAHLDTGLLFVLAIVSLAVYGTVLAGWSSQSSYALLGALRASAQMISYELTMGLALIGAFLVYGTLEPLTLVEKQASLLQWGIITQPLGFILFFFAAMAENKRAPFDLPEGESEIVGYFVEYSGTRFMMFYLGEFIEIVFIGFIITTIYLGGWQVPGLSDDGFRVFGYGAALPHWAVVGLRVAAFAVKVFLLCFVQLAVRWSVPRMRYDQLMNLGWKGMLPASIFNVVITAAVILWLQAARAVP